MPGFFDFLDRMVRGEPVFDDQDGDGKKPVFESDEAKQAQTEQKQAPAPEPTGPVIRKGDESSFPVVRVKKLTPRINGTKMQVYGWIENEWPEEIMLDKIRWLGITREIDSFLKGHEGRDFLLYDGPLLPHEEHEAQLDYKTQRDGDYFESVHEVTFTYHQNEKLYSVNEIRLREPIRDIYG
jgi:hypothetical protein